MSRKLPPLVFTCAVCGIEFNSDQKHSRRARKCCSAACRNEYLKRHNPKPRNGQYRYCKGCETQFYVKNYRIQDGARGKYCSLECCHKHNRGASNPIWTGGPATPTKKFNSYKYHAQKRGMDFQITRADFDALWQQPCHYCGAEIETIGIDRMDSTKGYTPPNVVSCCKTCNYMKLGLPLDVFLAHVDTIRRHMGKPANFIDKSAVIGENTTVWHFANVLADVRIGKDCSIGSHTEIGRGSVIGDGCRISAMCFLPSNSVLEERVFLGPGVKAADDQYPVAGNSSYLALPPYFESGCSVGMNSTILPGVRIGAGAMIGAGSIVTKNVAAHSLVRGEPARVKSYSKIHVEVKRLVAENAAPYPGVRSS